MKLLICVALLALLQGCENKTEVVKAAPTLKTISLNYSTLREAIASTRLDMTDMHGEGLSKGAARLGLWSSEKMTWSALNEIPLGKYGLVMKDPDSQRGSRLCVQGEVIEIALDRSTAQRIFLGGMASEAGGLYRFIAVKSTGEIMARSDTRFCGIVTGQQHYPNSIGGVAHAVHLVGMFDLPENKR